MNGLDTEEEIEKPIQAGNAGRLGNCKQRVVRIPITDLSLNDHAIRQVNAQYNASRRFLGENTRGPTNAAIQVHYIVVVADLHEINQLTRRFPMSFLQASSLAQVRPSIEFMANAFLRHIR